MCFSVYTPINTTDRNKAVVTFVLLENKPRLLDTLGVIHYIVRLFMSLPILSQSVKQLSSIKMQGFTLIELMITIVIIGILAAISIPSYNNYILKAHRKEGISQIYSLTERLERARSSLMSYTSFDNYKSSQFTYYQYEIDVSNDGSAYTITAVALGNQKNDKCGDIQFSSDNSWEFGDKSLGEKDCL